jgi:alpha-galactosidase
MTGATPRLLHLQAGAVSVVIDVAVGARPQILHWGAALGGHLGDLAAAVVPAVPPSAFDAPVPLSLLPGRSAGHRGRPGLVGSRDGLAWSAKLVVSAAEADASSARITMRDERSALHVTTQLQLEPSGLLRAWHELTNEGNSPYAVHQLLVCLPVPARATELLDVTGRWCLERVPQRLPYQHGTWERASRRGRTGHDSPTVTIAGTAAFGERSGEVWGVHLAWSGDSVVAADRRPDGVAMLAAGELLEPNEVVLAAGETYATPVLHAAWSDEGLDGIRARFHTYIRSRPNHPKRPRPVVLNTWEAVYFDHNLDRLKMLADTAAGIGVERFVLDDGWFRHRRDDRAGLGDWYADEKLWPDGLTPLVEHVHGLGMEFGLWVEPEMVNTDSDLYRAHPDWVLQVDDELPIEWRHQQVLDLSRPEVRAYLFERLDSLVSDYRIDYFKWDHNRDLVDAGGAEGRPAVHAHTLGVYELIDRLKAAHPDLEIESCSSGGARVDLGILARTDRVWASDSNDALDRQSIQRWTQLLLPPELVGAHVGPPTAHTTGRTHSLSFRYATALFGHFGMEWDIASASPEDRTALAAGIAFYVDVRGLLHSGVTVNVDHPDRAARAHGVVDVDRSDALFAYVQLASTTAERPSRLTVPGLDPSRAYRVEPVHPVGPPRLTQVHPPQWYADGGCTLTGQTLAHVGLELPVLSPEQALLLRFTANG